MGCRGRDGVGWRAERGGGEWKPHVQFTTIRMQKLRRYTVSYFSLLCTVLRSIVAPVIQYLPFQISKDQALAHPCPLAPHDSLAKPNPCVQMEECLPSYTPGRVESEADLKHEYLGFAKPYDEVLYELKLKYNVSV